MTRDPLLQACIEDPWALDPEQRHELGDRFGAAQERAEALLAPWVEDPARVAETPAFLLETEAYAALREGLDDVDGEPDLGFRDQAQRFVDQFAEWACGALAPR